MAPSSESNYDMNWVRVAVTGPHLSYSNMGSPQGRIHFANTGILNKDVVTALLKSSLSAAQHPPTHPTSSERARQAVLGHRDHH